MSEALETLRATTVESARTKTSCAICGSPPEVYFVLTIKEREKGRKQKCLRSKTMTLCAACAIARFEEGVR